MENNEIKKIIITLTGADKVGIVAKITDTLAKCGVNIEDIRQSIMQGYFIMMMLCDIKGSELSFKEIKEQLTKTADELEMEIWVQRKEIFDKMHSI